MRYLMPLTVMALLTSLFWFAPVEAAPRHHHQKFVQGRFYPGYGYYYDNHFYRYHNRRHKPLFVYRDGYVYRYHDYYKYPHRYRYPGYHGYHYRRGGVIGPGLFLFFRFGDDDNRRHHRGHRDGRRGGRRGR